MIWGEFINQIRNLHLELLDQYAILPSTYISDIELTTDGFPYPTAGDDYGDWETPALPEKILEALEMHPVERVLIEGPLMPIQEVVITPENWESLFTAVINLETEWLKKAKLFNPEKLAFIDQNLRAKFIQLQRRSGRFGLKAI